MGIYLIWVDETIDLVAESPTFPTKTICLLSGAPFAKCFNIYIPFRQDQWRFHEESNRGIKRE